MNKNERFLVEMDNGSINSFRIRDRWLLHKKNILGSFIGKDAIGHAACKGRIACGNPNGKFRLGFGFPSNFNENPSLLSKKIKSEYENKIGYLPKASSSLKCLLKEIKASS
ncbi:hypothetical protein [Polaribacter sp. SA4-12]|uniref:hypothetical protein n=1 Tax=Polaribacter sp. SA4-12 TaxID=1312072 RepID=UPI000B3BF941|nr:hypothetical protein [Polaribacter sp. SA4-12]ARV16645.1 hypothetical protein BTO07_16535 [Polaribacter sp. SA4-12]